MVDRARHMENTSFRLDDFTINISGSRALIGDLDYDKDYKHRVRALRGGQSSKWSNEWETNVPPPHLDIKRTIQ